jgi:DNA-binding FadR family transcriptional regulator
MRPSCPPAPSGRRTTAPAPGCRRRPSSSRRSYGARSSPGELKEGDTLPAESELIRHFQVSRPTLREAIRILESQDLISLRRGQRSGAEVHLPTIEQASLQTALLLQVHGVTLAEVMETWVLLEPKVVGMLATTRPAELIAALRRSVAADEALVDEEMRIPEPHIIRFHHLLIENNGNGAFGILLRMLRRIIERHFETAIRTRRPLALRSGYTRAAHEDHVRVLDLIELGDAVGAEELWRAHLRSSGEELLKEFGGESIVVLPVQ